MKLLIKISLRNLLRQKQRNVLLGIGIAFGMMVLVLSNAFSHGLSDILLNRVVKMMTGHILVVMQEKPEDKTRGIIRDKEQIIEIIKAQIPGDISISEGISTVQIAAGRSHATRALGNGASSAIVVRGVTREDLMAQEMEITSGQLGAIFDNGEHENPIILFDSMAENLNVQLYDTIRVRFSTVYGQIQAARFTIVGIVKSTNPFLSMMGITSHAILKPLIGLQAHETTTLSVVINNLDDPQKVLELAQKLNQSLQPGTAGYQGSISDNNQSERVKVLGINQEQTTRQAFDEQINLVVGKTENLWADENGALISEKLAKKMGVGFGDTLNASYETKFAGSSPSRLVRIQGIFQSSDMWEDELVILHPQALIETSMTAVPKIPIQVDRNSQLFPLTVKEWSLLEMSPDQDSWFKKYQNLGETDWHGRVLDVATMYALASNILSMEYALNLITLVAVLVLFFIILIGVVNTLRMTIRERTREIGTTRAIGMQRSDVRLSFIFEVVFLTFFASLAGIAISFGIMFLLGLQEIQGVGMFSMFLVDHHLHFLPTWSDIVINLMIILVISGLTAFFPANRAAQLSVAEALRHYE
jgi:ABC-type lipoprotein release transport system permease subunit